MTDATTVAARAERAGLVFARHLLTRAAARRDPARLNQSAYLVLACLDAGGLMTIGELAGAIGLDVSTMNRQTAALLRDGFAERTPDPAGGIARKLRMTSRGRAVFDAERAARVDAIARIIADWSPADAATLTALLERYNTAIEARSGHRWPHRSSG